MLKRRYQLIMLIAASVVACVVIAGGVLFAWLAYNDTIHGSIKANVVTAGDETVLLEKFNDDEVPEDGYRMYPEDAMKLGLTTKEEVNNVAVRLNNDTYSNAASFATDMIKHFKGKENLLSGQYYEGKQYTGATDDVLRDFDILGYLDNNDNITNETQKENAMLAFMEQFIKNNNLLNTMTVHLISVGDIKFYDKPLELYVSRLYQNNWSYQIFTLNGMLIPSDHPLLSDENLANLPGSIVLGDEDLDGNRQVTTFLLNAEVDFETIVSYGRGRGSEQPPMPKMTLADNNRGVFASGNYYAPNYNCYTFQCMTVKLSGI